MNDVFFKLNGVCEWLIVRFTGMIVLLYAIYLLTFVFFIDVITYETWYVFFHKKVTKFFSTLALFSVLIHSWLGISHVLTDYIKLLVLKRIMQAVIILILIDYLLYGMKIVWGI
ncbi:succinate dehydrogenase, hydrophobic membrane anchor protein [Blochmannia endosymbiont of Colobopsis nipponica]|uniref:succinate dehydrogenase, hydrophobic membrane anchor protein n=1 Tax=Blochmannia endosymbiont of Colobopsis nipponica TaxID=2681987 RepID=UPI001CE28555|nr:succinate dehydrogenase, hydrophobic membrane anchor protein [Blochmannia endosymbiont of Colobopsis nipponica]